MKQIFVLILLIGFITTLTPAVDASILWVVPDNPTRYSGVSDDFPLEEIVIKDVYMGSTFEGDVIILKQTPPKDEEAKSVYLKFFIGDGDVASKITSITIGTAERFEPSVSTTEPSITPNTNSNPVSVTFTPPIPSVPKDPPVPEGWGVKYLIGDIPFSGGPSVTGDPEGDLSGFDPDKAYYYIKVPFTITFEGAYTPEVGFTLYVYAENCLDCGDTKCAKTAYSHDAGFTHVPEFASIAIPVAAILGLFFLFNRRKRRK